MAGTKGVMVQISDELAQFVESNVIEAGSHASVSDYVSDLIRRDKQRVEEEAFQRLKAELQQAFATPDSAYISVTLDEFLARHRL